MTGCGRHWRELFCSTTPSAIPLPILECPPQFGPGPLAAYCTAFALTMEAAEMVHKHGAIIKSLNKFRCNRQGGPWTQTIRVQSAGAGFVVAIVGEFAPRSGFVELVEATCGKAGFDWNKAPKNLFGNEPLLSAQGTAGSCGS